MGGGSVTEKGHQAGAGVRVWIWGGTRVEIRGERGLGVMEEGVVMERGGRRGVRKCTVRRRGIEIRVRVCARVWGPDIVRVRGRGRGFEELLHVEGRRRLVRVTSGRCHRRIKKERATAEDEGEPIRIRALLSCAEGGCAG